MATWLITNAASGFGLALSAELLERGHMVAAIVDDPAQRHVLEQHFAARPWCYVLDLSDPDAVRDTVDEIEALGALDAVVHCDSGAAWAANQGGAVVSSLTQARQHLERHVFGAVNLIQATLPAMRRRRHGHVFNVMSMAGDGLQHGSASALAGITEALDQEMAGMGIRATAVTLEPGENVQAWQRAAQAILLAAAARHPPRRLLLGRRALQQMRQQIGELQDELSAWEMVSLNTSQAAA